MRQTLREWQHFIRSESHVLAERPGLLFQQAANLPDDAPPAQAARFRFDRGLENRPWLRWVNKPQAPDPGVLTATTHGEPVLACSVSPDGTRILLQTTYAIRILDANDGNVRLSMDCPLNVACARFSADGNAVVALADGDILAWDMAARCRRSPIAGNERVRWVALSWDDCRRAVGQAEDYGYWVWDLPSGRKLRRIGPFVGNLDGCVFTRDGRRVISWGVNIRGARLSDIIGGVIQIWDVETGAEIRRLLGHDLGVQTCVESPDGRWLASGSTDRTLKLWDVSAAREVRTFVGHGARISCSAFSPDGTRLASGAWDQTVRIWDVAGGRQMAVYEGLGGQVSCCSFAADGRHLLAGASSGILKMWETGERGPAVPFSRHGKRVRACAISPDWTRVASASEDKTLKLWDAGSGAEVATLRGHEGIVTDCAFSPDGRTLVSTGLLRVEIADEDAGGEVRIWEAATGRRVEFPSHAIHEGEIGVCRYSPDGKLIATWSYDGTMKIWAAPTGERVAVFEHNGYAGAWDFSPDGRRIICASYDGTLLVWDAASGAIVWLEGRMDGVTGCRFVDDGRLITAVTRDGRTRAWNAVTGEPARPDGVGRMPRGDKAETESPLLAPDADAKGGSGGTGESLESRRWEVRMSADVLSVRKIPGGQAIAGFHGAAPFTALAQGCEGERLAAGDESGRVYILEPVSIETEQPPVAISRERMR